MVSDQAPVAICLMGPTASGKTDLAVELTRILPCDIVSVDSALIYRGMDIGTAKPGPEVLAEAPHRLIDIVDPKDSYSVARFYQDALTEMQAITAAGRIPLLVGGTMMYFRVLRDGIAGLPSGDEAIRQEICEEARRFGWARIHNQLAEVDPESAARLKPTDAQRLQRALEVYRISGRSLTDFWAQQQAVQADAHKNQIGKGYKGDYTNFEGGLPPIPYNMLNIAIAPAERKVLHQRIETRFDQMLSVGFVSEVEGFFNTPGMSQRLPSMRCVGYRQVWDYLSGALDYDTMRERGIIASRQLAKRQLTWLRSWPELFWLESGDRKNLDKTLKYAKNASSLLGK